MNFRIELSSFLAFFILCMTLSAADPAASRQWTSSAGTKVEAVAELVKEGSVHLATSEGRKIVVPLASLIEEDRKILRELFKPAPPKDLPYPIGKISGPHTAGPKSTFHIYIPNSIREGRKAPVLIYTSAGGGKASHVKAYIEAAELNGCIIVANVESRNTNHHNYDTVKLCHEFLLKTLPIDENRDYFSGHSGGGSMANYATTFFEGTGSAPIIGYNALDNKLSPTALYYVMGGARDYNRYMSADIVKAVKERGFHRIYSGAHSAPPDWMLNESLIWFNAHYLKSQSSSKAHAEERSDWEENMIEWIGKLKESEPHRAYYWCIFLQQTYRIGGPNANRIAIMEKELGNNPLNTKYAAGLNDINEFSKKNYTGMGFGSMFNHVTPQIQSNGAEMLRKYAGVPHIEDVCKELGEKTIGK